MPVRPEEPDYAEGVIFKQPKSKAQYDSVKESLNWNTEVSAMCKRLVELFENEDLVVTPRSFKSISESPQRSLFKPRNYLAFEVIEVFYQNTKTPKLKLVLDDYATFSSAKADLFNQVEQLISEHEQD